MTIERQIKFWLIALAVFIAVLWLLSDILLPFVAGIVLAYLFDPLARRLERHGIPRAASALVMIALVISALFLVAILLAPILGNQLAALIGNVPTYVTRLQAYIAGHEWLSKFISEGSGDTGQSLGELLSQGVGWVGSFLRSLWSGGKTLISIVSLLIVTPVVAFYLLCDWDRMVASIDSSIPSRQRHVVRALAREIDNAIAGFVRGQISVCLILAVYYGTALAVIGLNFGLLIGLVAGLISFIPYFGAFTAVVVAFGVALAQFWPSWTPFIYLTIVIVVGQFLEGYVLQPKLVGERVGLHPVWLMFALFAFGYLFGFVGLLIAVPLAAAIAVLVRFALRQYLASPLYSGETS